MAPWGGMWRRYGFVTIVFVTTFVVNVSVMALWADDVVSWWVSVVVAGVTAIVLTLVFRRELGR